MRSMPTWLTISMLVGVFGWGCYEHARRVAAEASVASASDGCDSADDNDNDEEENSADDSADDNDHADDDDDSASEQGVTIVEVTTSDTHGSTRVVRIQ